MTPTTAAPETPAALTPKEQRLRELIAKVSDPHYDPGMELDAMLELTDLLPEDDGEPLESPWHFAAIALLKEALAWHWRDRSDYFVGGNMFLYYRVDELLPPRFRGPDL